MKKEADDLEGERQEEHQDASPLRSVWRNDEIVFEIFKANLTEDQKMTVQITPLHDRVLVRRLEEKETAKGGIIIPDTAKEKPQEGEVIAVGAGKIEKGNAYRWT